MYIYVQTHKCDRSVRADAPGQFVQTYPYVAPVDTLAYPRSIIKGISDWNPFK